jgi:hypothetical protein
MDGRIAGTLAATVTLIVLSFVALGLFTSIGGLMIAATVAIMAGAGAAAMVDPARSDRNAAVVAGYVAVLFLAYFLIGQVSGRYAPPGSRGGPAVDRPRYEP